MESIAINSDQEQTHDVFKFDQFEINNDIISLLNCFNCKKLCDAPKFFSCCDKLSCKNCYTLSNKKGFCLICGTEKPSMKDLDFIFQSLFDSVRVPCSFGCGKVSSLQDHKSHEESCLANPYALLPCNKCELRFTKPEFEKHDCTEELLASLKKLKIEFDKRFSVEDEKLNKIKFTLK